MNRIISFFRKKKPQDPNLRDAFFMLQSANETLDNISFYISLIKDSDITADQAVYMTRAMFALQSFRDEIQIINNKKSETERYERLAKQKR